MKTIRLTTAQALVKFLNNQYVEFDGNIVMERINISFGFKHIVLCGIIGLKQYGRNYGT